jgi:predicted O-methyltransferase YrrM
LNSVLDQKQQVSDDSVAALLADAAASVPGWTPPDQLLTLFDLALGSAALGGDLLELGTWCGRSAVALGLAARTTGCRLHCIDLFPALDDWRRNADGSYSMQVRLDEATVAAYDEQTVWAQPFERDILPLYRQHGGPLQVLRATLERYGIEGSVRIYRGNRALIAQALPAGQRLRLAFVDGDHGFDAVTRDIRAIAPRLLDGGWICFDDAFTGYDGVDRAIREHIVADDAFDLRVQVTRKMFAARRQPRGTA